MSDLLARFECSDELLDQAYIALDVDGTLTAGLNHEAGRNHGDVVEMLKYLYSKNVAEVFLATGRPPWSAKEWLENTFEGVNEPYVRDRFFSSNHVLFDGAVVCDLEGNNIFEKAISSDSREHISGILDYEGLKYGFDTVGGYFVSEGYDENYFPADEYSSVSRLEDNLVYAGYIIDFGSKDYALGLMATIDNYVEGVKCHYFYSFQGRHCAVINPEGINKMSGIHKKFEVENVDFERLIFFGDGENDLPVFEEALIDERIIAIPSPFTKNTSPILSMSKWSQPTEGSVGEVFGFYDY